MDPLSDIDGLAELHAATDGGDADIRIAIVDGPVDLQNPAFAGARLSDGVAPRGDAAVRSEHGTHVASIVVGQRGSAIAGIAPGCTAKIYTIYAEGADGQLLPSSQARLALAIHDALADGAHIINVSSGQSSETGQAQRVLADAVVRCAEAGTLIVAAAGNDGCRCLHVPAALDAVLAIGAHDAAGRPMPFSNFGAAYARNGLLAPGELVRGASPTTVVALRSGTSFAAPIVTGVAALLLSARKRRGADIDPRAIRAALLDSALPCLDAAPAENDRCLAGRLNVRGAAAVLFGEAPLSPRSMESRVSPAPTSEPPPLTSRARARSPSVPSTQIAHEEDSMSDDVSAVAIDESQPLSELVASSLHPAGAGGAPVAAPQPSGAVAASAATAGPAVATAGAVPASGPRPAGIRPSAAGCGCAVRPSQFGGTGQKVFAIGKLYYDFGIEARLDYFVQAIASWRDGLDGRTKDASFGPNRNKAGDLSAPYNPEILIRYLRNIAPGETASPDGNNNFPDANALIWTLTMDSVPIYAIEPSDQFAWMVYASFIEALWFQNVAPTAITQTVDFLSAKATGNIATAAPPSATFPPKGSIDRVSQAGHVAGETKLLNGTMVPSLAPEYRGFYQWNLRDLLGQDEKAWPKGAEGFLQRLYNEFRNVGIAPQNRALNYSAMNAYNTKRIFGQMATADMVLDTVEVDRSTICRPDSDCWDVTYRFFNPAQVLTQARKVFQYTIDVSDTVPVPVGDLRQWDVY